jgi:hypothetical protein
MADWNDLRTDTKSKHEIARDDLSCVKPAAISTAVWISDRIEPTGLDRF